MTVVCCELYGVGPLLCAVRCWMCNVRCVRLVAFLSLTVCCSLSGVLPYGVYGSLRVVCCVWYVACCCLLTADCCPPLSFV